MKSIVLVNQSSGYLTVDICNAFAKSYDRVTILVGKLSSYPRSLDPKVKVIPICKYNKSSITKRLLTWIKGSIQIRKYLSKLDKNIIVLYFTNPPMSYLWADKLNNKFGIVEYDIYPDALKNVRCPSFIIKWWRKRNKQIFNKAESIITLGDGMKKQLLKYCSPDKIKIIPNWGTYINPQLVNKEDNKFILSHNLQGKFIILYAGNIGYTHNVESIINVAELLNGNDNIMFVIIGEGGKKETLIKMSKEKRLTNVLFSDFLPSEDVKYTMSSANLGVVTLTKEAAQVSVPSKTYNLLSYGIPLLNISTPDSELGRIINENKCGESFEPNDIDSIAKFITDCTSDYQRYLEYRKCAKKTGQLFTLKNAEEYLKIFDS